MITEITEERGGILGMYDRIAFDSNKLFKAADKVIGRNSLTLPVAQEAGFTIIPVNIKKNGKTVRVIESGIVVECYHEQTTNNNCNGCGEFVE